MKTFEITFWTEPTKHRYAVIKKVVFTAKSRSEAIYDAENKHPTWAIIGVKEI